MYCMPTRTGEYSHSSGCPYQCDALALRANSFSHSPRSTAYAKECSQPPAMAERFAPPGLSIRRSLPPTIGNAML